MQFFLHLPQEVADFLRVFTINISACSTVMEREGMKQTQLFREVYRLHHTYRTSTLLYIFDPKIIHQAALGKICVGAICMHVS